jgi:hypothetical protein
MELWIVYFFIDQYTYGRMLVIEKSIQWVRYAFCNNPLVSGYNIFAIELWEEPAPRGW